MQFVESRGSIKGKMGGEENVLNLFLCSTTFFLWLSGEAPCQVTWASVGVFWQLSQCPANLSAASAAHPTRTVLSTLIPPLTMYIFSQDGRLAIPDVCFQLSPGHLHLKSAHYLRSTDPELNSAASSWTCAYLLLHFISVKSITFGQMGQGRNLGTVFDPSLSFNFHKPLLNICWIWPFHAVPVARL